MKYLIEACVGVGRAWRMISLGISVRHWWLLRQPSPVGRQLTAAHPLSLTTKWTTVCERLLSRSATGFQGISLTACRKAASGRGCVKTLFAAYFRGRRTITQAPIVDPGASDELDNFRGPSIFVFSHSLGQERKSKP